MPTTLAEPVVIAPAGWPEWPELTIFEEVASWCHENLVQPDGPRAGEPWLFTDQQALILAYWFAHDDRARWLFRRGTVRMMKGWGKDPIAAVLSMVELCGPSRVTRELRAERYPAPWVQVAAVSRDQTRTTMRFFPQIVPTRTANKYGMELNKELVYANGGQGVIESVTSSPQSLEGGRATLVIRNETQYWFAANQGHEMAEVIDGNLAKSRDGAARALSLCNAHVPGEDSVGEREWDAYQKIASGDYRTRDVLYVAVEAPAGTRLDDEESLTAGIIAARGDAEWLDPERLCAEVWDPRTTPSEARRKYLNQVVAAEDSWLAPHEWNALRLEGATLAEGEMVTLGFDGSKSEDHTGLIATRVEDGCTFVLGHWDPERFGGEVPRAEVNGAVESAFRRYDVVGFYSDVHPWESYIDQWQEDHPMDRRDGLCVGASQREPIAWDMRARTKDFTHAAERFKESVLDGVLLHDGNEALAQHVANARRRGNRWGLSFGKETRESKRRVDLLAAAVLSRLAYWDYLVLPDSKKRRRRTGKAGFF